MSSPDKMAPADNPNPPPPQNPPFTNLALVERVDTWPYLTKDPAAYKNYIASYYYFLIKGHDTPFGYIHKNLIAQMPWFYSYKIDHSKRHFTLLVPHASDVKDRSELMNYTLRMWGELDEAPSFNYWGDGSKEFPLMSSTGEHVLDMDGSGVDVFGVIRSSVHLIGWVRTAEGVKILVPRRALTKKSFAGMLDSTVGGRLVTGEKPVDGMIRKCEEEMGIGPEYTRANVKACGVNSFQMAVGDTKLEEACQCQVQYLFEMEIRQDAAPRVNSGDVGEMHLLSVDELRKVMADGEVKSTSNMVYLEFLIRHGYVNSENEPDLVEICSRLHRRLDLFFV